MYIPMGHGLQPSASVSKRHPLPSGTASLLEEEDPRTPGLGPSAGGHRACPCGEARERAAFRRASMRSKSVSFQASAAAAAPSSCCCAKKKKIVNLSGHEGRRGAHHKGGDNFVFGDLCCCTGGSSSGGTTKQDGG